jgi:hypothetical protein
VIEAVSRGNDIITYHLQMGNVDPMSWTDCFSDSLLGSFFYDTVYSDPSILQTVLSEG